MPIQPDFNKNSPDVSSGVFNSGEKINNSVVFSSIKPDAPTNLTATQNIYNDRIRLSWDLVDGISSYKIYRDYSLLTEIENFTIDTNNDIFYDDTDIQNGYSYKYIVTAKRNGDESSNSNEVSGYSKLVPISDLTASNSTHKDKIVLNWTASSISPTYKVLRGFTDDVASMILLTETEENTYEDYTAIPGTIYQYAIIYYNSVTESESSNIAYGTRSPIPETPTVRATQGSYTDKVVINWTGVEYGNSYEVYRDGILLDETVSLFYEDYAAVPGRIHSYYVLAKTNYGKSILETDNEVYGSRKLLPPQNITTDKGIYDNKITIKWVASYGDISSYQIYRSETNSVVDMQLIATTSEDIFEYTDYTGTNDTLTAGIDYYYSVKTIADTNDNDSEFSSISLGYLLVDTEETPSPVPGTPSITVSQGTYEDGISLNWNTCSNATGGYKIYRDGIPIGVSSANYLKYSSSFTLSSTAWQLYSNGSNLPSLTTASFSLADTGETVTGKELTFTADTDNGIYQKINSPELNATYTISVYAGSVEAPTISFLYYDGKTTVSSTDTGAAVTLSEDVQRLSWTFVATSNSPESFIAISNDGGIVGAVQIYGAQLEKGEYPTQYIETTTEPKIATNYFDYNSDIDTIYLYSVKSINSYYSSKSSNVTGFRKPKQPSLKYASKYNYESVTLKIKTTGTPQSKIKIYRGTEEAGNTDGVVYSLVDTISVPNLNQVNKEVTYIDDSTSLVPGIEYHYKIKIQFNGIDSEYSNSKFGIVSDLPTPYDSTDYAVWGLHWSSGGRYNKVNNEWVLQYSVFDLTSSFGDRSMVKLDGSQNLIYNENYKYKAIVPMLNPPCSNGTYRYGDTYNNLRHPQVTTYQSIDESQWNYFIETSNIIPQSRRGIFMRQWFYDLNPLQPSHINYYAERTNDGTSYPNTSTW